MQIVYNLELGKAIEVARFDDQQPVKIMHGFFLEYDLRWTYPFHICMPILE